MKIFIQWATRQARDYQLFDSASWSTLPSKPYQDRSTPIAQNQLDNAPGWIADLGVQGISFGGEDHYAVQDINDGSGGINVTTWSDSTVWAPLGSRYAAVWTILPLAPDARFGGVLNTRQTRLIYPERPTAWDKWAGIMPIENTELREWSEFEATVLPIITPLVRHGIWVTDAQWSALTAARSSHGWREWAV